MLQDTPAHCARRTEQAPLRLNNSSGERMQPNTLAVVIGVGSNPIMNSDDFNECVPCTSHGFGAAG